MLARISGLVDTCPRRRGNLEHVPNPAAAEIKGDQIGKNTVGMHRRLLAAAVT